MSPTSSLSTRGLIPGLPATITVVHLDARACDVIQNALNLNDTNILGVSLRLSKHGTVEAIALATPTTVFLIAIGKTNASSKPGLSQSGVDLARVLANPCVLLAGFNVARIALLLHRQTGADVYGVELTSLPVKPAVKHVSAADLAGTYINHNTPKRAIHSLWLHDGNLDLCLKAWILVSVAERTTATLATHAKVDTRNLQAHQLSCLSQLVLNIELVEADKPTVVENDFDKIDLSKDGKLVLRNARFKTRVRMSAQTVIEINDGEVKAQAVSAKGKSTGLAVFKGKFKGEVNKVHVIGREESTNAESARELFVLRLLQGGVELNAAPYVRKLWFPGVDDVKGKAKRSKTAAHALNAAAQRIESFKNLNPSQRRVAVAMIAEDEPIVVAHGPPGTGKTSTIAAALAHWQTQRQPAWVIAHSNVGVQNIAESLFKKGIDFKIIVSKEFHFEWHEHLYEQIERNLIRSDDFGDAFDAKNHIGNTTTMLCTLSMLSNPALDLYGIFRHVPVMRLIVDEASQIDTFEFMHLFDKFSKPRKSEKAQTETTVLSKVCMFGDPKQLPPFGSEAAPKMKTIFDFQHLKAHAYFLDTQYRMPVPLGDFISKHAYNSRLKSCHEITDSACIKLVDVGKGKEERVGSSWKNTEEANTIVNIVKKYYSHEKFCIITPYDAQRNTIMNALKAAGTPRFEHVYNVDSFQGHEAPYIIVSVVRTSGAGFLKSLNRMNVMLTRCQAGMVIVTQRGFIHNPRSGKKTLLGKLAEHWEQRVGARVAWADAMEVASGRATLPRAPAVKADGGGTELTEKMGRLSLA